MLISADLRISLRRNAQVCSSAPLRISVRRNESANQACRKPNEFALGIT
jgi:hypothetical protein